MDNTQVGGMTGSGHLRVGREKRYGKFEAYPLEEYPEITEAAFPSEIEIAYAVCGKNCGNREFIVDGQSQVCQYCGKLMSRTVVRKYKVATEE